MPTLQYSTESHGPKRLAVTFNGFLDDTYIKLDGQEVGWVHGREALKSGKEFLLPDGSTLKIKLVLLELHIDRNGVPVPGTAGDPATQLKAASFVLFFIAGLNIINSLFATDQLIFVCTGVIYLVLGFLARTRWTAALIIALLLFAVEIIANVVFILNTGYWPSVIIIACNIWLAFMLYRGVKAAQILNKY